MKTYAIILRGREGYLGDYRPKMVIKCGDDEIVKFVDKLNNRYGYFQSSTMMGSQYYWDWYPIYYNFDSIQAFEDRMSELKREQMEQLAEDRAYEGMFGTKYT